MTGTGLFFAFLTLSTSWAASVTHARIAQLNADNPHATFSVDAIKPGHQGGCYRPPSTSTAALSASSSRAPFTFTADELRAAAGPVSIDWRDHGAVGPIQQQHPFGTCWAFSMTAVTEAVSVIQGKNKFEKLSEQMVVSCVPATATGDNSDVLWSWALQNTGGRYQTESAYPYNRTCNSYRETQLAPDGTLDGYTGKCDFVHPSPAGPCPPCGPDCRADGTPPCRLNETKARGFSNARVQGWGFIAPHGRRRRLGEDDGEVVHDDAPNDVTRMVAALVKYGPAQIGIDASCVIGYTGGIITNCTRTIEDQDHAVTIVGAGTDKKTGVDYWLVRNSWDTTFGEQGYFRMQRDTMQMVREQRASWCASCPSCNASTQCDNLTITLPCNNPPFTPGHVWRILCVLRQELHGRPLNHCPHE